MKKPTKEQIEKEIEKLKEMKPFVRKRTFFGDDNHEGIDAQIQVLAEDMDTDDVYDTWPEGGVEDEEDDIMTDEYESVRGHALDALSWLVGDTDESPSTNWASLDSRNSEKIQ